MNVELSSAHRGGLTRSSCSPSLPAERGQGGEVKSFSLIVMLLLLILFPKIAHAQTDPISADEFWQRLSATNILITQAIDQTERDTIANDMTTLWQNVNQVRLDDGTLIQVDTAWLHPDLTDDNLKTLRSRVSALLQYRTGAAFTDEAMLRDLDRILQNERFQYGEEPEPEPQPAPRNAAGGSSVLGALMEIMLMIAGLLLVIGLLIYLAKNLGLQPVALDPENGDELPATSQAADEMADRSTANQDYRTAIRYLYLSSLLWLDEHDVIHYDSTQTNTEHLRQLREHPQRLQLLQAIVDIFDRVWYGFAPADERLYRAFRRYVDQLKGTA